MGPRYRFLIIEDDEDVFPTGNRGFSPLPRLRCTGGYTSEDNMEHNHQGLEDDFPF